MAKSKRPFSVGDAVKEAHRPLYHYTTADAAISILHTKTFWMSDPSKFNDPYDCRLKVRNDHSVERCFNGIGYEVRKSLLGQSSILESQESFINLKTAASLSPTGSLEITPEGRNSIRKWISRSIAKHDKALNEAADLARVDARVACFCQSGTKLPLWGYYGKSGKGVCIIVDFDAADWEKSLLEVEYRDKIPEMLSAWNLLEMIFNLRTMYEIIGVENLVRTLLRTKSMDWAHENEVRFAGLQSTATNEKATFRLDGEEIIGILAGYAIEPNDYQKLKQVARKLGIPYGQVKMRDEEYELYFD